MAIHLIRITGITLVITLCMFLPYMPGEYDGLATTLSFMAQLFCFAGLILVPVGIAGLIIKKQYIAITALALLSLIVLVVSISICVSNHLSFGIIILSIYAYFFYRIIPRLKQLKNAPLYLIVIPLVVLFIRFAFIDRAVDYSRNRCIQHSEQLIKDIETYYANNGHYPISMLAVHKDYKTWVRGIRQYHYEPNGKAYNLYFELVPGNPATREIVMYNPLDEHVMTSHDEDLLLLTAGALNMQRGYFSVRSLPNAHWKVFLFD